MKDVFELLNELDQADSDWIFSQGEERNVALDTLLTEEGQHPDAVYIVLEGLLGVRVASMGDELVNTVGAGEIVGEMSFLENRPAAATVFAAENSLVLALSRAKLENKMRDDPRFAAHLYRSFAIINARRLRNSVNTLGRMLQEKSAAARPVAARWRELSARLQDFKDLVQQADEEALKNFGEIPAVFAKRVQESFGELNGFINDRLGETSSDHASVKAALGAQLKRELLPYILLTKLGERYYSKPRGYAGDYQTIDLIYQNQPAGSGRIGPLLDRCFLNIGPAHAVRNRRALLAEEILHVVEAKSGKEPARVTSMAAGPAAEIFDVFNGLQSKSQMVATLIDIDLQALAFVGDRVEKQRLRSQIQLINSSMVYLATGRQNLKLKDQDLVYSIGIIDYFNDKFVVALLNYIYDILRHGGKVILGNYHPKNTARALMDYVLDWKLIHRTEADMDRLFERSKFGRPTTRIRFEGQGINLFAEGIKE